MNRYKVYLRSGTVITIAADDVYVHNEWLNFATREPGQLLAQFAPGMWEGYQDVTAKFPLKDTEKSGS